MRQIRGTLNKVELIGWIGDTPEQRFMPSGVGMCSFKVATKRPGARTDDGERTVETEWTTVEAWERLAESCARYLQKGSRVLVSGHLHSRSWEDKETGQRRYRTVVRADEVMFLDAKVDTPADVEEEEEEVAA